MSPMRTHLLPKVQITQVFRAALEKQGVPADEFAKYFAEWKQSQTPGVYSDPYFGKDGPYARPQKDGKTLLWHVHMRPENDPGARLIWDGLTRASKFKTSDAVLIYTHHPSHGYLLLYAVWATGAHDLANMTTPEAQTIMQSLGTIAEEFMFWGRVGV